MKQETLEEAATIYAHRSFVWPLNKQGEKQSIPPGQLVPPGYAKHQKVATKHFTNGVKWQAQRIERLRNELYEQLPTGEVNVFDLIKIINNHINKLDELI